MSTRNTHPSPRAVVVAAAVAASLLLLPLVGLFQRTPWSTFGSILFSDGTTEPLRLSLIVSTSAAVACMALGLPLGWVLARIDRPGMTLLRASVLLPMVLPPVAGGTALLFALGRRGLVGQWLDRWFGVTLPFTTAGAIVAATFVALPFFVVSVEAALRQLDPTIEETAASLGARPTRAFFTVTVPMIRPAIGAGLALAWARALGEFGATIAFAGDSPGRTRTLPVALFVALETEPERALVLSVILVLVSLAVLVGLRGRWLGVR